MDPMQLPGVAETAAAAEQAISAVHRMRVNLRGWPRTAAAASIQAARASAGLDGGSMEIDENAATVTDPVLAGAVRVAAALPDLVSTWQRAPLQVLARLHTLAAADLVGDQGTLGRPRPNIAGLPERLTDLAVLVTRRQGWAPVVTVAMVHGELLSLRPFGVADGVVARSAARLTMMAVGLDPRGLTVPEVGHLRAAKQYDDGLRAYRAGDVATWIGTVAQAMQVGAGQARSIAEAAG